MEEEKKVKVRLRVIMRKPTYDKEGTFVQYVYHTQWTDIFIEDIKPLPEIVGGEWVYILN